MTQFTFGETLVPALNVKKQNQTTAASVVAKDPVYFNNGMWEKSIYNSLVSKEPKVDIPLIQFLVQVI